MSSELNKTIIVKELLIDVCERCYSKHSSSIEIRKGSDSLFSRSKHSHWKCAYCGFEYKSPILTWVYNADYIKNCYKEIKKTHPKEAKIVKDFFNVIGIFVGFK